VAVARAPGALALDFRIKRDDVLRESAPTIVTRISRSIYVLAVRDKGHNTRNTTDSPARPDAHEDVSSSTRETKPTGGNPTASLQRYDDDTRRRPEAST
jgi:hypothetical protein